jgi:hypothetical protein
MSTDLSVRNPSQSPQQMADALLRASGGATVFLLVAPATGDSSDAGQVGVNAPNFQQMPLSPTVFRKVRSVLQEGQLPQYELLVSASAVQEQAGTLQMASGDALFDAAAGVLINGSQFVIESRSVSEALGQVYLYRILLRETHALLQPIP